ncbi:MAG: hypothetical protein ABIZ72_02260 [Candidatus Limnocylindrales bacterium]
MMPTRAVARSATALASAVVLTLLALSPGFAASAGPSAGPSLAPGETGVEAWLDADIPTDVAVGQPVHIGLTLWDSARQRLADFNELTVHLLPSKGTAVPSAAKAVIDWPGHLVADIVVPPGGAGTLAYGLEARVCTTAGSCTDQEQLVPFAGVGPPPDAPRSMLVTAAIEPLASQLVAGQPIDIAVVLEPRAGWDSAALRLPDRVVAIANESRGRWSSAADIPATGERTSTTAIGYRGQLTIEDPGDLTLQIAIPGNGTEDQVIPGATVRATVARPAGSVGPSGPVASDAPAENGIPWLAIGAAVLAVAGALVVRRVFADL